MELINRTRLLLAERNMRMAHLLPVITEKFGNNALSYPTIQRFVASHTISDLTPFRTFLLIAAALDVEVTELYEVGGE